MGTKGLEYGRRKIVSRDGRLRQTEIANSQVQEGSILPVVEVPPCRPAKSARLIEVALRFGLPLATPARRIAEGLDFSPKHGSITLMQGPSGAGKTLFLEALSRHWAGAQLVQGCPFPLDVAVIDAVAPTRGVDEAMSLLTACGLGEPALWLRRFEQLSEGERFRARLARAISLHRRRQNSSPSPLLCDEFGSNLHQRVAQAIAFNLRKLATRERLALVIATSRDDIRADLHPDRVIEIGDSGFRISDSKHENISDSGVFEPVERADVPSFAAGMRIEPADLRDYARFAPMHYRRRENIGFIDKVFLLRAIHGDPLAVVVYGHAGLELRIRNAATGGRFIGNPKRLNEELRVLKRLIVHPDVRGCGLGHRLVRETLPLAGVRFVECLAAMSMVNPVFEKAGMMRIGVCELPAGQTRILEQLRKLGADPTMADFVDRVCELPEARKCVARSVTDWYRGLTVGGRQRVERQSPRTLAHTYQQIVGSRPVYSLWAADEEGWQCIEGSSSHQQGGSGA